MLDGIFSGCAGEHHSGFSTCNAANCQHDFLAEKAAILGLKGHFLGLKRGKIGGLQLLIRQQDKNASY